ncbi:MAG: thiosulfate oxidation carrier protein SoxY [Sulfuricurvum sp.]|nr:thiosulfate oxidation carrier protein SoxY [Sulfuricurvum sp.]
MERRSFLKGFGMVAACTTLIPQIAGAADEAKKVVSPNEMNYDTAVAAITGGKPLVASAKVAISAPEIAENGAVVPVKVTVESPMSSKDFVKAIHILASKNGNVRCANVYLTPANGEAYFGTRVKLGGTQDVVAIAEMSDGTFLTAKQNVKVTIGGCG